MSLQPTIHFDPYGLEDTPIPVRSPGHTRNSKTKFTRRLKDKILHHPNPLYTPTINIEDARGLSMFFVPASTIKRIGQY